MDAVIEHLKEQYIIYLVGLACAVPVVFFTRKRSVPILLYALECTIYSAIMHILFFVLVKVTRWFKENSSMKALQEDGRPIDAPTWGTPLTDFWKRDLYDPTWVFYAEIVAVVIIIILVIRFRPMKVHRPGRRKAALERQKAKQSPRRAKAPARKR